MKYIKFFLIGILFGIIMTKSEIISWFRIQEMFRFHSFHMYGVIGSAVILGVIQVFIIKKINFKNIGGKIIEFNEALNDNPELVNDSPYGEGWIIKVEVSDVNELEQLLDSKSYSEITG